jgi:hypothetical protein
MAMPVTAATGPRIPTVPMEPNRLDSPKGRLWATSLFACLLAFGAWRTWTRPSLLPRRRARVHAASGIPGRLEKSGA